MWILADQEGEIEAVNLDHVVSLRLQGSDAESGTVVIAGTINDEEVALKTCLTMSDARDWVKNLVVGR